MSVPLGLLERFERVAACRHRTLGETQQRIHRLGDIVNRVGVSAMKGFAPLSLPLLKKVSLCLFSLLFLFKT